METKNGRREECMGSGVIVELQTSKTNDNNKRSELVDEMARLEKKTFPKHESLSTSFHQELAKNNTGLLYCLVQGQLAGYVMYARPSSLAASITKLAVKEKYRRQGHGEALLRAAIEKCRSRNVHYISLHVDPSRTPAVNLYKKIGFRVDTLVKGYYSPERSAYRMCLDSGAN